MAEHEERLFDERCVFQVLGCLMLEPSLLDEYHFQKEDFKEEFFMIIYGAIFNLYSNGSRIIDKVAIDNYLSHYEQQYATFKQHDGMGYVEDCRSLAKKENFSYNHQRLKKLAYLRYVNARGLDVRPLFDISLEGSALETEQAKFDKLTVEDLIAKVENTFVIEGKTHYMVSVTQKEYVAGNGIRNLISSLQESPDFGISLVSSFLNTIYRGARLGTVYLISAPSGVGKTRVGVQNLVHFSIPHRYDCDKNAWIHEGMSNPSLIISTELELNELQTMILAQVSGVSEDKILSWNVTKDEESRIDEASAYIEASPLYIVVLEDFSREQVFNLIRKYHREFGVDYVYFDYIQSSLGLLNEMTKNVNGIRLREDQVLYQFVSALKALARQLNIFILSATQLSGTYHDGYKDETILRGAKAMADKIDCGEIIMIPTVTELKAVDDYIERKIKMRRPNRVKHIYKCRGGKYTKIKVFCYIDLGKMTLEDMFVTDSENVLIDIPRTEIEMGVDTAPAIDTELVEQMIEDNSVDMGVVSDEEVFNKLTGQNTETENDSEHGMSEAQLAMRRLGF